ncbi:hypothetical protein D3C77_452480 [compost metagenome]
MIGVKIAVILKTFRNVSCTCMIKFFAEQRGVLNKLLIFRHILLQLLMQSSSLERSNRLVIEYLSI